MMYVRAIHEGNYTHYGDDSMNDYFDGSDYAS